MRGGKKKGKKADHSHPSNPKLKYHQKTKNRGGNSSSFAEQHHKQEAPLFLPVSRSTDEEMTIVEDEKRTEVTERQSQSLELVEEQPVCVVDLEEEEEEEEEEVKEEEKEKNESVTDVQLDVARLGGASGESLGSGIQTSALLPANEGMDLSATSSSGATATVGEMVCV